MSQPVPKAVLFDRDGTLIVNVPYNGDPARVEPLPGVLDALQRLRAAGLRLAVVTNQSGVGRGLIGGEAVRSVNARVEELLGPFEGWFICPHAPQDGCDCRKPQPGLVLEAAEALGLRPDECVVIGDADGDVEAAHRAGAQGMKLGGELTLSDAVDGILQAVRGAPRGRG